MALVAMEEMAIDSIPVDVDVNDNEDEGMWYDASMTSPRWWTDQSIDVISHPLIHLG